VTWAYSPIASGTVSVPAVREDTVGTPSTVIPLNQSAASAKSVCCFCEQRLQGRVLERLSGVGVVEHLLKHLLQMQRFVDCHYRRVVGIREDGRWYLYLSQPILDLLPGLGAVPALRECLNILDPFEADLGRVAPSQQLQGVVEILVKVVVETDRDENLRVVVELRDRRMRIGTSALLR
jgi:hypothetical protein